MLFESITGLEERAISIIRRYHAFADDGGLLDRLTDTQRGGQQALNIRALDTHRDAFCAEASSIADDESFTALDPKVQRDVQKIRRHCTAAQEEIGDAAHPDNIWADLVPSQRDDLTQRVHVKPEHAARIKARLKGELDGVNVPPLRERQPKP